MSRKLGLVVAALLGIMAFVLLLAFPSWARSQPVESSGATVFAETASRTMQGTVLLSEGFEGATFPPPGWTLTSTAEVTYSWRFLSGVLFPPHSGTQSAGVLGEPSGSQQRELLLTPEIQVANDQVKLEFWVKVLARDRFADDNDVELWVVRGAWDAGGVDDVRLDPDDIALKPPSNNIWVKLSYDLAAYQGEEIRIAWRYSGVFSGDFLLDDVLIELEEPQFKPPHSYIVAPYKIETGQPMAYVLVISNTGSRAAESALVRDVLPSGVSHVAGTASVALGSGVVGDAFTDTASTVEWAGTIPTATGLLITIPVQVAASSVGLISNEAAISDPIMVNTARLKAETQVYAEDTLMYYESFNGGPGDGWQGIQDWAWGKPVSPLDHPHSWPGAWGTKLDGNYTEGPVHILTGTLDLTSIPVTKTVFMQWWEWFEGEGAPDAGLLKIDGNTVYEVGLNRKEWTERQLAISQFAGERVAVTFVLTTSGGGAPPDGGGWYIDDVAVHAYPPTASFSGSWKRSDRTKVAPGGSLTYTFYITNSGDAPSIQGRMRDELPAGLRVGRVEASGRGIVSSGPDFIEWSTTDVYSMPIGTDATITAVVDVTSTLACGQQLINSTAVAEVGGGPGTLLRAPAVGVYHGSLYFATPFDVDDSALTAQGGVWEWGETVAYGAGPAWYGRPAHSDPKVWGTGLATDVLDASSGAYTLTLPALNLGAAVDRNLTFQWWDWFEPGDDAHLGTVLISSTLHPTPTLVYQVSGDQGHGWQHRTADASSFAGHTGVQISFVYHTDGDGQSGPGWYVDSVALHDSCFQVCYELTDVQFEPSWTPADPDDSLPSEDRIITFTASYEPPTATQPIDFVWDWGDGTAQSSGQQATHIYEDAGAYNVVLTTNNCGGPLTYSDTVTILTYPVYGMTLDAQQVMSGTPGSTVVRSLFVTNRGNRVDDYDVTKSSETWTTLVSPKFLNRLMPGESRNVLVGVTIPSGAQEWDSDTVLIQVASRKDPNKVRSLILKTLVPGSGSSVLLPLVLK
jgi:uncharacterized repeat protein (TIGR01451 family)